MVKNIIISILAAVIIQPFWKYAYLPKDIFCTFLISFLCVFFAVDNLEEFLKGVNKMTGWVKIHRQIMDHWLWKEQPYDKARAFMDLVLTANREDKKKVIGNNVFMIYRGSFFTTSNELAELWGWSRGKVQRFLEVLKRNDMIQTSVMPEGTVVSVLNYSKYQGNGRKKKEEQQFSGWMEA